MDIVHCLDDRYAPMCATAIVSLCENNPNLDINYHIISVSLNQNNKAALKAITDRFGAEIRFYDVNQDVLKDCVIRENDHVSLAAYLRILIPKILPDNIKTALYLDCDLIIIGDISELLKIDLVGFSIGVVKNGIDNSDNINRLEYDKRHEYFNSGVMLMNLDYWRHKHIMEETFDYIYKYPHRLKFWDQDALNGVLFGTVKYISPKYNVQDSFYLKIYQTNDQYNVEIINAIKNPVILHFSSSRKPWYKDSLHPLKNEFFKYLRKTPWHNYKIEYSTATSWKSRILFSICPKYYIYKSPYIKI